MRSFFFGKIDQLIYLGMLFKWILDAKSLNLMDNLRRFRLSNIEKKEYGLYIC